MPSDPTAPVTFALLCLVLVVAAWTDVRTGLIYNWLTLPAMALGLVWSALAGAVNEGWSGAGLGLGGSFVGLLVGLVPCAILVLWVGLGAGDAKLMGAVGALTASWQCVLETLVHALLVALLLALVLMIRHRIVMRTLGRLLGAAMLAASRVKPTIPQDSPRVPFALAIAVGGVISGSHLLLGVRWPWL